MSWGVCDCGGGSGGSPSSGGAPAVGGWFTGGSATGGLHESGGACSTSCALGNCCSTPNSYCVNGNLTCQCINGIWGACNLIGTGGASGTGGTSSGGGATGGWATGGTASVPVCDTVESLPTMGVACTTWGESRCDPSGNQCVCERGVWYCNTSCASTYPTEPTPYLACVRGAACNYPSGVSCSCINLLWMCMGRSGCPADIPTTGDACGGMAGVWCDYPNANPHMTCVCMPYDGGLSWTCMQSSACPATQPAYDLTNSCQGLALCTYDSTRCSCQTMGTPWVCGIGVFLLPYSDLTPAP
jgi:hypothetical protein